MKLKLKSKLYIYDDNEKLIDIKDPILLEKLNKKHKLFRKELLDIIQNEYNPESDIDKHNRAMQVL